MAATDVPDFAKLLEQDYFGEIIKVVRFLSLAEAIGSKLLTANTTKLAATLAEFRRVAERDVYGPLLSSSKFKHVPAEDKAFEEKMASALAGLLPRMKDEETLAANWDAVQATLEDILPQIRDTVEAWRSRIASMTVTLKAEQQDAIAAGIRASQALFIREAEEREAEEAARFAKTRAGKKMKQIEEAKRREEAEKRAAEGGKKKKGEAEELDYSKLSVKQRREAREAAHAQRVKNRSAHATPATVVGEAAEEVEKLHL